MVEYWVPQPGPQTAAATCPADEIFFGGTKGGGKTDAVVGRHCHGAGKYAIKWNGLIVRKKYKDFAEIRRRFDELILQGMPAERTGGDQQINYVRWRNGAQVLLAAMGDLAQADDYFGHQYTEISIDEAPTIPFIAPLVDKLKGSLRSPHGIPCHMFLTGNPGGAGSGAVKVMYIEPVPEGTIHYIEQEGVDGDVFKFSRVFIRSTLNDNKILVENDPQYVNRLLSIADPALRAAWIEGDWSVYIGQAFHFTPRHVIEPIWPIPEYAPIFMTFDWGFGAPFSIGWWWVDSENRIYRFAEWYGWDGITPNKGIRITDPQLAAGILERENAMGISDRSIIRLSGPDCFNKKPDYKGGGQGPSTATEFKALGIDLAPGDPSKELKIRQFRNRLALPADPNIMPMLVVYNTCRQFIRIIPSLCSDELTGEYLEKGQELHPFDEACHICMARPTGADVEELLRQEVRSRAVAQRSKLDSASRAAAEEMEALIAQLAEQQGLSMDSILTGDLDRQNLAIDDLPPWMIRVGS